MNSAPNPSPITAMLIFLSLIVGWFLAKVLWSLLSERFMLSFLHSKHFLQVHKPLLRKEILILGEVSPDAHRAGELFDLRSKALDRHDAFVIYFRKSAL